MTHTYTSKQNKRYRYYACTRAIKRGREACPTKYLPAAEIERAVVDEIRGIGRDASLRGEVWRQVQQRHGKQLAALRREHGGLKRELTRHHAEVRRLVATGRQDDQIADLHDRIARAETRMGEIGRQMAEHEHNCISESDVVDALADFDGVWKKLKSREQAELLQLLIAGVEFDAEDDSISIQFYPTGIKGLA